MNKQEKKSIYIKINAAPMDGFKRIATTLEICGGSAELINLIEQHIPSLYKGLTGKRCCSVDIKYPNYHRVFSFEGDPYKISDSLKRVADNYLDKARKRKRKNKQKDKDIIELIAEEADKTPEQLYKESMEQFFALFGETEHE